MTDSLDYRVGINAVIADVASPCAAGETAMFFAVGKFKQRHMSMYQHQSLRDSMPLVTMDVGDYVHRCATAPMCIVAACEADHQQPNSLM